MLSLLGSDPQTPARIAGAPISWGVCEVPGWGWQYDADAVLGQMRDTGLQATEFGPDGFLPDDPTEKAKALADKGLRPVGGFLPVLLHDPAYDPVPKVERAARSFQQTGANVLVLAAATGRQGYDGRPELDQAGWTTLLHNLDRVADIAVTREITASLHPHVGTMVETAADVDRVLQGSTIGLCLDTGHLLIGGADPVRLAQQYPDRIRHVHLKDVDATRARQVQAGQMAYTEAVRQGIYRPLGAGDIDIAAIVTGLERSGYQGWYVLEQDTVLDGASDRPRHDAEASLDYLRGAVG